RNLMTHTAGFEDELLGFTWHRKAEDLVPLADTLRLHVPARILPPVTQFDGGSGAYSNYGAALAGLIVENVSGMSYDDYIAKNIFTPLGMSDSTFREPLPEAL